MTKTADKLLQLLEISSPKNAPDGPGAPWILQALTYPAASSEQTILQACEKLGRLAEVLEGARAAAEIGTLAAEASQQVQHIGEILGIKGPRGDQPLELWLSLMLSLYHKITGKPPAMTVFPTGPHEGEAGGELIDFLAAAGDRLGIIFGTDAWRSKARRVIDKTPHKK